MTKADIADRIQVATGMAKKESVEVLESVLSIMKSILERGETLKISGFGNFVVKEKKERRGRNPHTGETITIASRRVLTFRPSSVMKNRINGEQSP